MSKGLKLVTPEEVLSLDMIGDKVITAEEQALLQSMNKIYCHVVIGGKHRIMAFKPCSINGRKMTFETPTDYYNYFAHKPLLAGLNQGLAWFRWPGKAFYSEGIGYYPETTRAPKNVLNTFQSFPCKPGVGDVSLILSHIKDVLCDGDYKASDYFILWLAHIFQKPMNKPSVAVLMKSAEGTGKGTLFRLLQKMLGANYHQVNGVYQITGRFNGVIAGKLLICGDEVDLTNKPVFDKAKGVISETTISMELKGIDPEPVPNYARFIFAGNHDNLIAAGTRERRFLVLEPSTHKIDDSHYWEVLNNVIDTHGAESFLHYLLNISLDDFSPYKAPATKGLIDEKLVSLKPSLAYLHIELSKEKAFDGAITIPSSDLVQSFRNWADLNGLNMSTPSARSQIGKAMKDVSILPIGRSDYKGGKVYKLPESDIFRERFAALLGHEIDEVF